MGSPLSPVIADLVKARGLSFVFDLNSVALLL